MRYSYVFCILAGLGLAGCETAPEINSSVTGDGTAVDRTTGDRTAGDWGGGIPGEPTGKPVARNLSGEP